jgi:predicted MPP superfamily phosphohydrolase
MKVLRALVAAGSVLGAYSLCEPYLFRLSTKRVPLAAGTPALTVLHISDTHMRASSKRLRAWLEDLPKLLEATPDLVLATGDLIEDDSGIEPVLECLARIEARLGRFYVLGSHDYYQSQFKPPTKYLDPTTGKHPARRADVDRLQAGLCEDGWIPLLNTTFLLESPYGRIRLAGVDDPYIKRHRTGHIERASEDVLAIGLMHAPDVVGEWFEADFDLVVAGHTHGGQVRIPGIGALVTNSSLPTAFARGLHRIGNGCLHVSPGLGTGRYSPIRFACRPEATLLRLEASATPSAPSRGGTRR